MLAPQSDKRGDRMYKLKKGDRTASVVQNIQLAAFLSSGWKLVTEDTQAKAEFPTEGVVEVANADDSAPKRRGRRKAE